MVRVVGILGPGCGDIQSAKAVTVSAVKKRWIVRTTNGLSYMHIPSIAYSNTGLLVTAWQVRALSLNPKP